MTSNHGITHFVETCLPGIGEAMLTLFVVQSR